MQILIVSGRVAGSVSFALCFASSFFFCAATVRLQDGNNLLFRVIPSASGGTGPFFSDITGSTQTKRTFLAPLHVWWVVSQIRELQSGHFQSGVSYWLDKLIDYNRICISMTEENKHFQTDQSRDAGLLNWKQGSLMAWVKLSRLGVCLHSVWSLVESLHEGHGQTNNSTGNLWESRHCVGEKKQKNQTLKIKLYSWDFWYVFKCE